MLEMFLKMQNKRRAKGGFTLVELIVVLVILAILAALLIPALTGYIDKAKEKSIIAETRQVVMAAQTLYDEKYGTLSLDSTKTSVSIEFGADKTISFADVKKLAEVKGEIKSISAENNRKTDGNDNPDFGKISSVSYTRDNRTCTYSISGGYSVTVG
nr:prepilin-type N-terminal cleavage/methylation domain-containing protein [uncultured Agathobaculum sp.]